MRVHTEYSGWMTLWVALDLDRYDGAPDAVPQIIGYGDTEKEAVQDLKEKLAATDEAAPRV